MKSTSPESSAATRVAAFWIGVYSMRVTCMGNWSAPQ